MKRSKADGVLLTDTHVGGRHMVARTKIEDWDREHGEEARRSLEAIFRAVVHASRMNPDEIEIEIKCVAENRWCVWVTGSGIRVTTTRGETILAAMTALREKLDKIFRQQAKRMGKARKMLVPSPAGDVA